ncbi:MAG TPA: hypothetical protein VFQ53_23565 [Kofleriaceae bacterium]|nr:hypothetical protein [Kofleriaceae bacterium]
MSKTKLAVFLFAGLVGLVGCTSDDGGGGDDGGDLPPFTNGVSTLTGHADPGYADGKRGVARFSNPVNVAYGPNGLLYVADFDNGKLRVVDAESGDTGTTIATMGFKRPFAMAFAPDGTLYVTTDSNPAGGSQGSMTGTIWRVDVDAKSATPIANDIGRPRGIVVLPTGKLAVADYQHHVIELVDPASGQVSILAGTWDAKGMADGVGAAARFSTPYGMALAKDGRLVVADFDNNRLRVVALDGTVETYAGSGVAGFADGAMGTAEFNKPQGVAVDAAGDFYVTDLGNYRVRKVTAAGVETIAGDGMGGYIDSDDRLASELYGLEGISVAPSGAMVFVADGGRGEAVPYNRIRSIKMQ